MLEEKWGVSAAAPVAVAAPVPPPPPHRPPRSGRVHVILAAAGDKKINVIKAVRDHRPRPQGRPGPGRSGAEAGQEGVPKADAEKLRPSSRPRAPGRAEASGVLPVLGGAAARRRRVRGRWGGPSPPPRDGEARRRRPFPSGSASGSAPEMALWRMGRRLAGGVPRQQRVSPP